MRFSCECGAQYMISDEKVGPNGVKVRCKKCGNVVSVKRAPAVAPEVVPRPAPEPGRETTLERELGDAFENVFGGGSPGLAAEAKAAQDPANGDAPPAAEATNAAQNPVAAAEAISDWYVAVDDSQVGPLPAPGVKARWESGEIGPDTLTWRPGMADWVPLSTIPEMAQYLAPIPRGGAKPAAAARATTAAEPRADTPKAAPGVSMAVPSPSPATNGSTNGAANGHDAAWKPSAASALAALASEEMASLQRPEPRKADPAPESRSGSLVDRMDLPDGGVDPTNLLPLPIKGLEVTGESALRPKAPSPVGERTEIRHIKKSATRSVLAIGVVMAVLFAAGIGVVVWFLRPAREVVPASTPVAQAPAPVQAIPPPASSAPTAAASPGAPAAAVAPPAPTAPPPSTGAAAATVAESPSPTPSAAATPPATSTPAATAAAAPASPEPARAAPVPEREPPAAAASRPHRRPKPEPLPGRTSRRAQRLAAAERAPEPAAPAPAPAEPPRRKAAGDPLLDVGGDDDIEKELSGKGPSKRSVYVPPAIGSDLPEGVSVSQINEAVVGQKSALLRCIEQQKAADPDTRGTLKVRWIISGDGSVRDVRVVSDEFARQPIAPCISGVVKSIRFPRTRTTGQEVVFPFKF
ncbi:MAG TPA: AgmX/PglI C-terminal domain-containing protein [Anaeromyxobacteraceae bacterium]